MERAQRRERTLRDGKRRAGKCGSAELHFPNFCYGTQLLNKFNSSRLNIGNIFKTNDPYLINLLPPEHTHKIILKQSLFVTESNPNHTFFVKIIIIV